MTRRPTDILILGHNYAPEPIGIGPCTTGMAEALAASGHRVRVICGQPSYPYWKVAEGFRRRRARRSVEGGVQVLRLPLYVPRDPCGLRRILHNLSFAVSAGVAMFTTLIRRRPDVIVAIAPSAFSALVARFFAWISRRPLWVHVQDFEVEMAMATGQLAFGRLGRSLAHLLERAGHRGDLVSSISPRMCDRLIARGSDPDAVVEFRNWANPAVRPLAAESPYRAEWQIDRPFVALYSGNIAAKQGIDIVVAAARLLAARDDLLFVICGNGTNRNALAAAAADCPNIRFHNLQPPERLSDLLGLATVHLLPQIAGAADLVLPSKLPNMLASGRAVIATAQAGTGLADAVHGCGIVAPPHDVVAFAEAITRLIDDRDTREAFGAAARRRALERWNKEAILSGFEHRLRLLDAERRTLRWSHRLLRGPRAWIEGAGPLAE
jgi:colanic acid biosynthesis glycosyl transferase WcaI